MSLRSSPRFVRSLVASLLLLGLAGTITLWAVQQHTPRAHAAAGQLAEAGTLVKRLQPMVRALLGEVAHLTVPRLRGQ